MKKRIAVVGAGTAGLISLGNLLPKVTNSWDIVSIYDPTKPILGIGESTNPNFVRVLQEAVQFTVEDMHELDATLKFGTKYKRWRENEFVNPLFGAGFAIHFNNFALREFFFKKFYQRFPQKFKEIHGDVSQIIPGHSSAKVIVDGKTEEFDYVIDCRGFPPDLSVGYIKSDCSPVNHCVVYSVPPENQESFTEHIAMKHGWMFGVPLTTRTTYGYLYNDTMSKKEDVVAELGKYLNVDIDQTKLIEYKFTAYYARTPLEGRVLKNGNRALFFEPLSASSIYIYVSLIDSFIDHLISPGTCTVENVNEIFVLSSIGLEDMLSYIYHGGSTFNTKFWGYASKLGKDRLAKSVKLQTMVKEYNELYEKGLLTQGKGWFFTPTSMRLMDEKFGYNYLKK